MTHHEAIAILARASNRRYRALCVQLNQPPTWRFDHNTHPGRRWWIAPAGHCSLCGGRIR